MLRTCTVIRSKYNRIPACGSFGEAMNRHIALAARCGLAPTPAAIKKLPLKSPLIRILGPISPSATRLSREAADVSVLLARHDQGTGTMVYFGKHLKPWLGMLVKWGVRGAGIHK